MWQKMTLLCRDLVTPHQLTYFVKYLTHIKQIIRSDVLLKLTVISYFAGRQLVAWSLSFLFNWRDLNNAKFCVYFRKRVPPSSDLRGMSAAHLRPVPHARQRFVLARGLFAMRCVSTAADHDLLLPRQKTVLQTGLPTVRTCFTSIYFPIFLVSASAFLI